MCFLPPLSLKRLPSFLPFFPLIDGEEAEVARHGEDAHNVLRGQNRVAATIDAMPNGWLQIERGKKESRYTHRDRQMDRSMDR